MNSNAYFIFSYTVKLSTINKKSTDLYRHESHCKCCLQASCFEMFWPSEIFLVEISEAFQNKLVWVYTTISQ